MSRDTEPKNTRTTCFTIGHSTASAQALVQQLRDNGVDLLADVRTMPRSRHNPQFNHDAFPQTLARHDIGYHHLKGLGGLRKAHPDSINDGWRNASFRGYADYMQTAEFEAALAQLLALADDYHVAIMCAEAVPWRCHRSLVADAIMARGGRVTHIIGNKTQPHRMTSFAIIDTGHVSYPAPAESSSADLQ